MKNKENCNFNCKNEHDGVCFYYDCWIGERDCSKCECFRDCDNCTNAFTDYDNCN
jgi:hypothetical protein